MIARRVLRYRSYWKAATLICRVTGGIADPNWCVLRGLTTTRISNSNRDCLDDAADIDSYVEDDHVKGFKKSRDDHVEGFKKSRGKKVFQGKNFRERRPAGRTVKRSRRYSEDDYERETEYEADNDFKRHSERKDTYKDWQFPTEPVKTNQNKLYKHLDFNLYSGTSGMSMKPAMASNRPARRDIQKVDASKLAPFEKNFYKLHPDTANFTDEEVKEFRQERHMTVQGSTILKPLRRIEEAGFPDFVGRMLSKMNITTPSPIQSQCWPMVLSGLNMVGIAQTGSGKTLTYALPALVHTLAQPRVRAGEGPIVLIVAPTRELTQQIIEVVHLFNQRGVRGVSVYGGASKRPQERSLMSGAEICVATPGRLNDLLSTGATNLDRCTFLVLDEADRMLDMGFEPQIREIVNRIRDDRQTVMWSATWPVEVHRLAREFLGDYSQVRIGSTDVVANHDITQIVEVCNPTAKQTKLKNALVKASEDPDHKILIFFNTKRQVDWLHRILQQNQIPCSSIHGDKDQMQRNFAMRDFRSGRSRILLATDVAARGLDVKDITHVINYDFPAAGVEDYIHRIGRTARANKKGTAITFFTPEDAKFTSKLVAVVKEAGQEVPPELMSMVQSRGFGGSMNRTYRGGRRR